MQTEQRQKIVSWVGSEILPHEGVLRGWLSRSLSPHDVEDIIQEAYCRISALGDVTHIRSGRAYLFTTARMLVLERMRRARVVSIEAVAELDALPGLAEERSPERIAAGRHELARVRRLIGDLPERCRRIFEMRKIEGLTQREVALTLGVAEHIVENDVAKGLKLILRAIARKDEEAEAAMKGMEQDGRARDRGSDC